MIYAYDRLYLEKAQITLGWMFDFAVYELKYEIQEFYDMFIISGIAGKFAKGDITTLVGRSGVELAYEVVDQTNHLSVQIEPHFTVNRSPEYWTGWALAYYQWYTSMQFSEITGSIPIKKIVEMYDVYHEMDIMQAMSESLREAGIELTSDHLIELISYIEMNLVDVKKLRKHPRGYEYEEDEFFY